MLQHVLLRRMDGYCANLHDVKSGVQLGSESNQEPVVHSAICVPVLRSVRVHTLQKLNE